MRDSKKTNILLAMAGAAVLLASSPVLAQDETAPAPAAAEATTEAPAADAAAAPAEEAAATETEEAAGGHGGEELTPIKMFNDSGLVVKVVMIGLLVASIFTWVILIIKLMEFGSLNSKTNRFLESFRGARSLADMRKIATSDEFDGNPLADMAAAATEEVELSRQAGLSVTGEHRDATITRASTAVAAVQSGLAGRVSGGQQFLASTGSSAPFVGLFGTVYGVMNSFIGIAQSNTTNLAVVAPGIAEALLATGIGLFAAIPAVIFFNYFNTRIAAYGTRSDGFAAELLNAISRQLDKGA